MLKSKEVIFPQPLRTVVKGILQAAEETGARYQLTGKPTEIVPSLLSQKLSILYERWLAGGSDGGTNKRWREFAREFQIVKTAFPDVKTGLSSDPGVVVLSLPHIPTNLLANEVLQRKFVRALGISGDWQQWPWQNLLTSHPPCTALSAWGDGSRVFCNVIRDQGSLLIKSDRGKNTEEFLLLSSYPGVAAGLWFYPPTLEQGTLIGQLIPRRKAVIETSAFFSPNLLLGSPTSRLTPAGRDRFLKDLFRQFSKI